MSAFVLFTGALAMVTTAVAFNRKEAMSGAMVLMWMGIATIAN
jgi:hypothetical protein